MWLRAKLNSNSVGQLEHLLLAAYELGQLHLVITLCQNVHSLSAACETEH